jgi:hypothetical protein
MTTVHTRESPGQAVPSDDRLSAMARAIASHIGEGRPA